MSKAVLVTIIGVIVAIIPINGLPAYINTIITVLAGIAIVILGLLMRVERLWMLRALSGGHKTDAYTENGVPQKISEEHS